MKNDPPIVRLAKRVFPNIGKGIEITREDLERFIAMIAILEWEDHHWLVLHNTFGIELINGKKYLEGVSFKQDNGSSVKSIIKRLNLYAGRSIRALRIFQEVNKQRTLQDISEFGINTRVINRLRPNGITKVGELLRMSELEFLTLKGTSIDDLRHLQEVLAEKDLCFSMTNVHQEDD